MTDRDALIAAIAAAPADDLPRLVFADWLEENGDPGQAAFIRKHIEYARAGGGSRRGLADELKAIAVREAAGWVSPLCEAFGQPPPRWPPDPTGNWLSRVWNCPATADALHLRPFLQSDGELAIPCNAWDGKERGAIPMQQVSFRRGLVERLVVGSQPVRDGTGFETAFRITPASNLYLSLDDDPDAWVRRDGPWFARLRLLTLAEQHPFVGSRIVEPVFHSPHLTGLRSLTLLNLMGSGDQPRADEGVCMVHPVFVTALAASPLAGRLRVLRLPYHPATFRALLDYPTRGPLEELCPGVTSGRTITPAGNMRVFPEAWRLLADVPFRPTLKRLSLSGCQLHDAGLTALCRGPRWDGLLALRLDGNPLTDAGGVAFARLAPFPKLQALRLDHCQLADDTARALTRSRLARTLRTLDLSHNRITADGALPLAVAFAEGPLRRLRLVGNAISRRRRYRIRDILHDRVVLDP